MGKVTNFVLQGTDKFSVDPLTGVVRVALPIDRESQTGISDNEIRLGRGVFRQKWWQFPPHFLPEWLFFFVYFPRKVLGKDTQVIHY